MSRVNMTIHTAKLEAFHFGILFSTEINPFGRRVDSLIESVTLARKIADFHFENKNLFSCYHLGPVHRYH